MKNFDNRAHKYHELYDTLFNKKIFRHKMRGINSKNQELFTYERKKNSTFCYDDKRYIFNNGSATLPDSQKDILK